MTVFYLCCFAFLAGFIDAIGGGGGLIQLPALRVFLPHSIAPGVILGTNKLASIAGTSAAAISYTRKIKINWRLVMPAVPVALCASFLGARAVSGVKSTLFWPLVLILLIAVAVYTFRRKDFGAIHAPKLSGRQEILTLVAIAAGAGFYDGFFGPGTGSLLVFCLIRLLGFDFLVASATTKVLNVATNASALAYFAVNRQVLYGFAVPMAACNILGGVVGSRVAMQRGQQFVRRLFLVIVVAVIARYAYDVFHQ